PLLVSLLSFAVLLQLKMEGTASLEVTPKPVIPPCNGTRIQRAMFPSTFVFGMATAAYQVEGAFDEDGRGLSIWDVFARMPGKVKNGDNGDVACDQYHRYEEDVALMADMGINAYRFSISWPRIFPLGSGAEPNPEGIAYYNRLIDALLKVGIEPWVTLYHWDLPQKLHESYGGWLGEQSVRDFQAYAETCFRAFGDRVKHWITFNEPLAFVFLGYGIGIHAPGLPHCGDIRPPPPPPPPPPSSPHLSSSSPETDTGIPDAYIVGHNVLRAHAAAVDTYRRSYQPHQGGKIGITLDHSWCIPVSDTAADKEAAERRQLFGLGWFLEPVMRGNYPEVMRKRMGCKLPSFTAEESALLRGSIDFLGVNFYTSAYVADCPSSKLSPPTFSVDAAAGVTTSQFRDGQPIGERAASSWLYITPEGIGNLLLWITKTYDPPAIYITENGMDEDDNPELPLQERLRDPKRVQFYNDYLLSVSSAMSKGAPVQGYFAWSLLDNFEWAEGYTKRFGVHYVDFKNGQARYRKSSAYWWADFLKDDQQKE
ncbi:hypothetical protein CBR_g71196, partial [Chara braunii]